MSIVPNPSPNLKAIVLAPRSCRARNYPGPHTVTPGKNPHRAALRCRRCSAFVQWVGQMALDILALLDEGEVAP